MEPTDPTISICIALYSGDMTIQDLACPQLGTEVLEDGYIQRTMSTQFDINIL